MRDVIDHTPFADDDTDGLITTAVTVLAASRGLHHRDPAARLHLLASLCEETRYQLLAATLDASQHGYSATQIAVMLHL